MVESRSHALSLFLCPDKCRNSCWRNGSWVSLVSPQNTYSLGIFCALWCRAGLGSIGEIFFYESVSALFSDVSSDTIFHWRKTLHLDYRASIYYCICWITAGFLQNPSFSLDYKTDIFSRSTLCEMR